MTGLIKSSKSQQAKHEMNEATETKKATDTTPVPIDKRLHKILKQRALDENRPLRAVAEEILGAAVGWHVEDKEQLKLAGVV